MTRAFSLQGIILHTLLIFGLLLSLFPFFWMVVMATNDTSAVYSVPPTLTFGSEPVSYTHLTLPTTPYV